MKDILPFSAAVVFMIFATIEGVLGADTTESLLLATFFMVLAIYVKEEK